MEDPFKHFSHLSLAFGLINPNIKIQNYDQIFGHILFAYFEPQMQIRVWRIFDDI